MASTNKTTNYELSQFTSTDKPAWLGDYNQDMNKIDAQMKNNANGIASTASTVSGHTTAIAGLNSDVETAQTDIASLDGRVDTLEAGQTTQDTAIQQAQSDATTAINASATNTQNIAQQELEITSLQTDVQANETAIATNRTNINSVNNALTAFKQSMTLSKFESQNTISGVEISGDFKLTLAQSSDSSTFKLYGTISIGHGQGAYTFAKTAITGLSGYYGIKTSLKLDVAPSEAFIIDGAGGMTEYMPGQEQNNGIAYGLRRTESIAVDSEGYIYVAVSTTNTETVPSWCRHVYLYYACLYFNTNFGDVPQPPNEPTNE